MRNISKFQGGPTACNWVSTIVANSARDIRRKRFRRQEVAIDEGLFEEVAVDPATRVTDHQMLRVLREMVARLPDAYRQVIEMRLQRELSTSETAQRLGISRSIVASRLHRGLHMLRKRFKARMRKKKKLP
ncbi:MAG: sigma-70 family RNA polymerase sigma factor [Bryobacterales bacterium]|nr:sigma-70 family RNA polymerase sigma factor [Bryobacterales bacterium]